MEYVFQPIIAWPGTPTRKRTRAQFKASYQKTLDLLDRELRHLNAPTVTVQLAVSPSDIRLDGWPRAGAQPSHPGVILTFNSKHGPMTFAGDAFLAWEDNLRSIALALEHLRTVERYGVIRRGEQYRGFTALPPPIITPPPMTSDHAAEFIAALAGPPYTVSKVRTGFEAPQAYRAAVMKCHPDRGGDVATFQKLQRAKEVLGL